MDEVQRWVAERAAKDDRLYEQYGEPLETEHSGEIVAISDDGRTILGDDLVRITQQAVAEFGRGTFAVRRIGASAEIRWRRAR